ncbi:MAG: hypothetical protein QOG82_2569 [Actinomycetota bacterium]|jgi:hypothetical protein|nr:hypothetical protein [Actinomycetota bacterium]
MRLRPALILAAPAGVLVGHAIGYLAAPGPAGAAAVHHGYLALVLAVAVPLGVMAVGWAATAGAVSDPRRGPVHRAVPVGPLLLAQWLLFTAQEMVEHAVAGHGAGAALQSPALWCGLAAQIVTAVAVVAIIRASAATGARLVLIFGGPPLVVPRLLRWFRPRPSVSPQLSLVVACPSRGPPPAALV